MKKELFENYFKGKKVTVLGLGLLGRGVGDTVFLAEHGAEVICSDDRSKEKLAESIAFVEAKHIPNLQLSIGQHHMEDFENRDFILTCPGMPIGYPYIEHAKSHNIPVYMSAALVVDIIKKNLQDVTVIGITGTRGKSTTTSLIAHILKEAGHRVYLGGNIRGVANLPLLEQVEDGDYVVLELDSWQLQGFGTMNISPDIAVFTSFLDDHLNYYNNDRELYFKDKAHIFVHQTTSVLIASEQAQKEIHKRLPNQEVVVPDVRHVDTPIIGKHNDVAISLAVDVAQRCGISSDDAYKYLQTFAPVPGRLEKCGVYRGVTVYNDNNATTPDAVIAGITAICDTYNVQPILITGGSDKGLALDELERVIQEKTKAHVLLAGTGTDKLHLSKEHMFERLEDCISQAFALAQDGDVILFSPGFASFSKYFNNEYERNDTFVKELQKYA